MDVGAVAGSAQTSPGACEAGKHADAWRLKSRGK